MSESHPKSEPPSLRGWLRKRERHHVFVVDLLFVVGASAMFLFMVLLVAFGMVKIFKCIFDVTHAEPIPAILEGLEYIFLAPLGFLLFRGIHNYVAAVIRPDPEHSSPAFLLRVKSMILGLIAAVAGTDLLKRAVTESGLKYETTLCGCLFIATLGVYSLLVERSVAHESSERNGDQPCAEKDNPA